MAFDLLVVAILLFAPLAWGSNEPWAMAVIAGASLVGLAGRLLWDCWHQGISLHNRHVLIPMAAFLGLVGLQYFSPRSALGAPAARLPHTVDPNSTLTYSLPTLGYFALVVLVSNLIDEVNSFQVKRYLQAQVGRHLPLCVLLRDRQLFEAAEPASLTGRNLYRAAAAAGIRSWRHEVLSDLQHQGVLVLDVFPEELTAPLVNRYLDIKARHLL